VLVVIAAKLFSVYQKQGKPLENRGIIYLYQSEDMTRNSMRQICTEQL
jgi:hypothetical protein